MCTLRIGGADLDVDALLRAVPLKAAAVHRRGEQRAPSVPNRLRILQTSTVNVAVSDAEFTDVPGQIADALAFLRDNADNLQAASQFPGVEHLVFDFAVEDRDVIVQCDVFPAPLLARLGALGADLEVTRYPLLEHA